MNLNIFHKNSKTHYQLQRIALVGKTMLHQLIHYTNFLFLLTLVTLLALARFVWDAPHAGDAISLTYLLSLPSYYVALLVIISIPGIVLLVSRWSRIVIPVLAAAWLVFLIADIIVFDIYRFHINPFLIQMFIMDFKGMGLTLAMQLGALLILLIVIGLAFLLWVFAQKMGTRGFKISAVFFLLSVVIFAANQTIHIWADSYKHAKITRYTPLFPLYYPILAEETGREISRLLPSIFPPGMSSDAGNQFSAGGHINYPREIQCTASSKPANILMIVLESWQADTLNAQVMPTLNNLAQQSWLFTRHISGGNATVPGLFSLLYGLHPTYYEAFKVNPAQNPSLFTETLARQGYQTRVFSYSDLRRFDLSLLFFPKAKPEDIHLEKDAAMDVNDRRLVNQLIDSYRQTGNDTPPRFDFMFLGASHYPYTSPENFRKFMPVSENKSAHFLNKNIDATPLKNDYFNSLNYLDSLFAEIETTLKAKGQWDNTWVIVTSDHAEEFNENGQGFWGHGSNYTRWQTQPPLLIKPAHASDAKQETRFSSHQDVVPTLMTRVLGCKPEDIPSYANGTLLTALPETRKTVIASYMTSAYWIDGIIYDKSALGLSYRWGNLNELNDVKNTQYIQSLIKEESLFFRH